MLVGRVKRVMGQTAILLLLGAGVTSIGLSVLYVFQDRLLYHPNPKVAATPARVDPVYDMKAYTDGNRTGEMYHIWPTPHSNGLLVAYIPREGVLFQGDYSLPQPGQPGNDHVKALVPALEKLQPLLKSWFQGHGFRKKRLLR